MDNSVLDIAVVGGGINGAGIALDAVGRGLNVALYEADDFGCGTSSASSKLLHGGLRYLELGEFTLVKKALAERDTMLKKAPFLIWPLCFCLPHRPHLRPVWMIRAGLFLYDFLARPTSLPSCQFIRFDDHQVLKNDLLFGFEYSDCWVDDARLVILNIMDAAERGAEVRNRCKVTQATRKNGLWELEILDLQTQTRFIRWSKCLVNATGPWVEQFFECISSMIPPCSVRLVKGSHLVLPKLYEANKAYILQNKDGRVVFVLPYLDRFSMIGTTDIEFKGDPLDVSIDQSEIEYLLNVYNQYFQNPVSFSDVYWSFSGVRPLYEDASVSAQKVTRDYRLELDEKENEAPLLSIFGGKLTTYRVLAQEAVNSLFAYFPHMGGAWTECSLLPGSENITSFKDVEDDLKRRFHWMDCFSVHRLATTYGARVWVWLEGARFQNDLGQSFGFGLTQREVDYLIHFEYVRSGDDLLWRRTKLGLYLSDIQKKAVTEYIEKAIKNTLEDHSSFFNFI